MTDRLIIIGAGQAGFAMAAKLRALKDTRPITILGAEDVLPYQRPPLSKKYLLGEMSFDRLLFRPNRAQPVFIFDEFRERNRHQSFGITLKRSFGGSEGTKVAKAQGSD